MGAASSRCRGTVGMKHRQAQITVERSERALLIRANGLLDRRGAAALLRLVDLHADLITAGRRAPIAVVIDLHGISQFEPAGLRLLRDARSRARHGGFRLLVTGCSGRVHLLPFPVQQLLAERGPVATIDMALATLPTPPLAPAGAAAAALRRIEDPEPAAVPQPRTATAGAGYGTSFASGPNRLTHPVTTSSSRPAQRPGRPPTRVGVAPA
ncbi:STAS domain-containing protein [Pseudonocardia parietis]|uniref:Anti-anti-sigma regulatory factor n=1 Tax=Pseudonocardia parietis TaxID=570936 RepID=A0ABS4W6T5_9PSEU|nr:STAS domain-containing protein [Pseudonocardia parietis]MBP2371927.1 anti-anti-sigma regulatory factor [Pseudonocardia parietis]